MRPTPRHRRTIPLAALLAAAVAAVSPLAGCAQDPNSVAAQARAGDRKGFVSGDGAVEQLPAARRGDVVSLSGSTLEGQEWSLAQERGKVVVLNVWGSWCAPCVAEAPDLQEAWSTLSRERKPVQFMGVNYRDPSPETAAAFLRSQKVTYPSLADDGGKALLALQGKAVTTPTTLVLDRRGRIAARVSGKVGVRTLTALVGDVLAEPA